MTGTETHSVFLSDEDVAFYRREGYVIVRGVLRADEIEELQRVTSEFIDRSRSQTESDNVIELDTGHTADAPRIRRIKSPHRHHQAYAAALAHPVLLDLVEQLIGPDIRWHHTKLNAKAPGGGRQVECTRTGVTTPTPTQTCSRSGLRSIRSPNATDA